LKEAGRKAAKNVSFLRSREIGNKKAGKAEIRRVGHSAGERAGNTRYLPRQWRGSAGPVAKTFSMGIFMSISSE